MWQALVFSGTTLADPKSESTNNLIVKPQDRQASLVIVFDTTLSMENDLIELRAGAKYIVKKVMEKPNNPIFNYVFVPFNDPSE